MAERFRPFAPAGPVPRPPDGHEWQSLMRIALAEARQAASLGEVPVGAAIVKRDGQILATAANAMEQRNDPTAHAEILAIRRAASVLGNMRLSGAVLVVTLEPCLMCAGAIIHARLDGLVFGAADVRAGGVISNANLLDYPGIGRNLWYMGGLLSRESATLLTNFFCVRRGSCPEIFPQV